MTQSEMIQFAETLEARIASSNAAGRQSLQPKLHKLIVQLGENGFDVPRRLKRLDNELVEEAIEARFDNMPV
ncbi:hypothetical protein [Thalassococcus sp. S3]|uniref:hypothetical protein n=1 Tax=Thalassococcus sp. S3 TaxID=2017482 RepID=UPI0010248E7B|nr:hypothetical protein [Thalassococcus sp. S3]QBF32558.1 hypothetical protein CFI11_15225 [Thalassococcus sp. S3]